MADGWKEAWRDQEYLTTAAAATGYQPLDSDLTTAAGLGTALQVFRTNAGATAAEWATVREVLTANRTYYVRTDGSDSNTGLVDSAGGAFLTLQKACDVVFGTLDLSGFAVTVQVRDGTYTGGVSQTSPQVGAGVITFLGNTGTPANCIISTTSASCFTATGPVQFAVNGFKLQTTTSGNCVEANQGATVSLGSNMDFAVCATRHVAAIRSGIVTVSTGYTISGGAAAHFYAEQCGIIFSNGDTFTTANTPAFSTAFCHLITGGNVRVTSATFNGTGATGTRYNVASNSVLNTNGAAVTYFPGNAVGSVATGGIYI